MQTIQLLSHVKSLNPPIPPQLQGSLLTKLLQYKYFINLSNDYGRQYLHKLISYNLIQTYVLRKGLELIDQKHVYVIVKGKVNVGGMGIGQEFIVDKYGQLKAIQDTYFFRIKDYKLSTHNITNSLIMHMKDFQHQQAKLRTSLQLKIQYSQDKTYLMRRMKNIQIFSKLSHLDFLQLVIDSKILIISKGKQTHEFNSQIKSLFYIISGQIKMSLPIISQQYEFEQNTQKKVDHFLQKFMISHKKQSKYSQITSNLSNQDWIGLDQHFFQPHNKFKSYGTVMSVQAKVLQIPLELFKSKFNLLINSSQTSNLQYLTKNKKDLLQRSLKAQQKKQGQMLRWSNEQNSISPQLRKKISHYQFQAPQKQQSKIQNQQAPNPHSLSKKPTPHPIPIKVVHLMSDNSHSKLNQMKLGHKNRQYLQRINLFEKQYEEQLILPHEKKMMQIAKQHKQTDMLKYLVPKTHRAACIYKKAQVHNNTQGLSFQRSYFSLTRKVSDNFAMGSTFYRNFVDKGNQLCNLNAKTIDTIKESTTNLLSKRRKRTISRQPDEIKYQATFMLPGIHKKKSSSVFIPLNKMTQQSSKYNLMNNIEKLKKLYDINQRQTISYNDDSHSNLHELKRRLTNSIGKSIQNYNKTLFINKQELMIQQKLKDESKKFKLGNKNQSSSKIKYQKLNIK